MPKLNTSRVKAIKGKARNLIKSATNFNAINLEFKRGERRYFKTRRKSDSLYYDIFGNNYAPTLESVETIDDEKYKIKQKIILKSKLAHQKEKADQN